MKRGSNPNFLNGVPELLILQLLRGREMYGYELVQAIRDSTDYAIILAEGVVYPVLHMLEREGALTSRRQLISGRNRIYYSITSEGERRCSEISSSWHSIAQAIRMVLKGQRHS